MSNTPSDLLRYLRVVAAAWRNDPRDDAELLVRFAQSQEEAAFAALVCRHGPLVWRTCLHILGNTQDTEDAFQATFLTLARKASRVTIKSLAGWLHQVAWQAALDARIGTRRHRELELRLRAVTQSKVEENTGRVELYKALDEELAGLPERLRVPLLLHYFEGRSQVEVARLLGCARSALQKRLTQGEAILRQRLERRGLTVGVVSVGALLGSAAGASAVPARLIGSTARAAVAFRSGALTGRAAEAAQTVLGAFPSSLETTIMRKGLWIVLACCLGLGGMTLITYRSLSARPDGPDEASPAATQAPSQPKTDDRAATRVDCFGDPLPQGALARLGTVRLRHLAGRGMSVAFSPDGKTVASRGGDGMVRLWDPVTGKEIRTLTLGRQTEASGVVAFTPDGKTVASGSQGFYGADGTVRLWETATGKEICTLRGFKDGPMAFTPDVKILATERGGGALCLWEIATGKKIHTLSGYEMGVRRSAFSPDGKTLASAGYDGTVRLWNVTTGKEIHNLKGHQGDVLSVAFSPDGKTVVSGGHDETVRLWNAATGEEIFAKVLDEKEQGVFTVAFAPDGKTIAVGSIDGTLHLWNAATGKEIRILLQGGRKGGETGSGLVSVAFSTDGKMLVGGRLDGIIHVWDVATGKPLFRQREHERQVFRVAFAPDGKTVVTGGKDGIVCLWDAATGKEIRTLPEIKKGDWSVAFSGGLTAFSTDLKTVAAVGKDMKVRLWDTATGRETCILQWDSDQDHSLITALSPDGKLVATGGADGTVRLWATTTGRLRNLWRVMTGKENRESPQREETITSLAFSPDGKFLAMGGIEGSMCLLEVDASSQDIRTPCTLQPSLINKDQKPGEVKKTHPVTSLAFSPDSRIVAAGGSVVEGRDGLVRLWETVNNGKELCTLPGKGKIVALAFSPDSRTLAVNSGDCVQLWDLLTGKALSPLAGHRGHVLGVAFSPDSKTLASVSADTTGLLWDLTSQTARPATKPDPKTPETLWTDLASTDARRAWRAVWILEANPAQTVPLLRDRLRPVPADAGKQLPQLIAALDSNDFQVRQKAYQKIEKLGLDAELALRKSLEGNLSVELRKRLKQLLEQVNEQKKGRNLPGEVLRGLRGLMVLERIGTPQAREVLKTLAAGGVGLLTDGAQVALRRLEQAKRP